MDSGSGIPLPDEKRARKERQGRRHRLAAATTTVTKRMSGPGELSNVSLMPPGLLKTLSDEEILDRTAYLESMGDTKHPNFSQ